MKRAVLILLAVLVVTIEALLVVGVGPAIWQRLRQKTEGPKQRQSEDERVVELPATELANLQVNHQQGSLRFMIGSEPCFFYIHGADEASRTLATSALLSDLQRATTVQIRHERYGIKRRATNFMWFFGRREVPDALKLQTKVNESASE